MVVKSGFMQSAIKYHISILRYMFMLPLYLVHNLLTCVLRSVLFDNLEGFGWRNRILLSHVQNKIQL